MTLPAGRAAWHTLSPMSPGGEKRGAVVVIERSETERARLALQLEGAGLRVEASQAPSQGLAMMRARSPMAAVIGSDPSETELVSLLKAIRRYPGWELLPIWVIGSGDGGREALEAGADGWMERGAERELAGHLVRAATRADSERRLREAECCATLRRAARTIAHYMSTPANMLAMCMELLIEPYPEGSDGRLIGKKMEHQLDRIRELVQRLQAVVGLQSDPVVGDPDVLLLPDVAAPAKGSGAGSGRIRTLLVDDEPEIRGLVKLALERSNRFEVEEASNGKEAVAAARQLHPELIVLDLVMPVMDGAEACRAIRADPALRRTPVIMLTMMTGVADMVRLFELGASGYLVKPFDAVRLPEQLLRIIDRQIR